MLDVYPKAVYGGRFMILTIGDSRASFTRLIKEVELLKLGHH